MARIHHSTKRRRNRVIWDPLFRAEPPEGGKLFDRMCLPQEASRSTECTRDQPFWVHRRFQLSPRNVHRSGCAPPAEGTPVPSGVVVGARTPNPRTFIQPSAGTGRHVEVAMGAARGTTRPRAWRARLDQPSSAPTISATRGAIAAPAVGQLLGEPRPADEHVGDAERELLADGPRDLGLQVVDLRAERSQQAEPLAEARRRRSPASRGGPRVARRDVVRGRRRRREPAGQRVDERVQRRAARRRR